MGFAQRWIEIVMNCLTSVWYAILINGQPTRYITPTRGIRQGDPLSPYLFILCAEGLSAMISKAVACQSIKGLVMCHGAPTLHHLFFANDNFFLALPLRLKVKDIALCSISMNKLLVNE